MKDGYIKTNIGMIPVEEYKEIVAMQHGFDNYEDMLCAGVWIGYESRTGAVTKVE